MKNSLLGLNSQCEQAEESVDLKWKKIKNIQETQQTT